MVLPFPPRLDAERDALFLDFDGTLVPLAEAPDEIEVPVDFAETMAKTAEWLSGALAIVSGRGLASLDRHGAAGVTYAAGLHGAELRGVPQPMASDLALDAVAGALGRARQMIADAGLPILIEDKGKAIALHHRQHPLLAEKIGELAQAIADGSGGALVLQPGHHVYEIRPAGISKADAVDHFLEQTPFAGRRPIFVGDDLTDEDGFRAATAAGGYGILVGNRAPSAARYRLADVAEVYSWLGRR